MKRSPLLLTLAAPALAVALALAVSALVLAFSGNSVVEVYRVLAEQLTEPVALVRVVNRAAPYYVAGVAVAIGFKMNLFNIGVEGQYRLAALIGAAAGASFPLPGPLRLVGVLLIAMAVGAAWAGIAGVLKAYRGVSEVISTIMLNAIALGLTPFMLTRWFEAEREEGVSYNVVTERIPAGGRLPQLDALVTGLGVDLPGGVHLQSYFLLAALVGLVYYVLVWRTRFGFDLRASGTNAAAARASGVDARRMIVVAMLISGAVAGLVGLSTLLGAAYRYSDEVVIGGLGFTGIAVALLGRNHPIGIALGALLWAYMDVAQTPMSRLGLPKEITTIMQGVIVLSVVVAYEVVRRASRRIEAASLARSQAPPGPAGPDGGGAPTGAAEVAPA